MRDANLPGAATGQIYQRNISADFAESRRLAPSRSFTAGTQIATPKGSRRVQDLHVGDRIITRDNGVQEIRWLGRCNMRLADLVRKPYLQPVFITQGALGNGLPERDMFVAPNQRMLVGSDTTVLYFRDRETLIAAKHLTSLPGVKIVEPDHLTFIHFMFDQNQLVLSDGTWVECFQPRDATQPGVGNAQRAELLELFPELKEYCRTGSYPRVSGAVRKYGALKLQDLAQD